MKKTILVLGIIFLFIGVSLAPLSGSISIQTKIRNEKEDNVKSISAQCQPIAKKIFNKSTFPQSLEGIPISGGDYDEYHPSIAGAPGGEYYAMAEYSGDGLIWHPMLYGSLDAVVWDPLVEFLYDNAEYTDMDQNDHGTYGTFGAPPEDSGILALLKGENLDGCIWDFYPDGFYDFSNNRIACYTFEGPEGDPGEWNWGAITCVGYNGYNGNNIEGCPFIFYPYHYDGSGMLSWLPMIGGCEHAGSTIDLETNMHYAVFDRDSGNGNYNLYIRKDNFGVWIDNGEYWKHPVVTKFEITATENLTYPSITAYDNNVIIACQKDDDIIVYYSTNGLSSKTEVLVETDAFYPEVAIAGDGMAVITYIKGGTLYHRSSDDSGATWTDPYVVSDNQVNLNDRAANLDTYKGNIDVVWEDIRGDNVDIYTDMVLEIDNYPPKAPHIDGEHGVVIGEEFDYYFRANDPDGDDVRYHIDWGDECYDLTDFHMSDEMVTIGHTYEFEGCVIITACAEDKYGATGPESYYIPRWESKSINQFFYNLLDYFYQLKPYFIKSCQFSKN